MTGLPGWIHSLAEDLNSRRDQHLYRELNPIQNTTGRTVQIAGKTYLQFSSNNYLGLANHPQVIQAARLALEKFGAGSGSSRLVLGSIDIQHELEAELLRFKGAPKEMAALVFPTGYMANLAVLTTFAGPEDAIISDKLNHASLLDAARFSGAIHRIFPHKNYAKTARLLAACHEKNAAARVFVVTDSVFSMDGDLADLPHLSHLCNAHNAILIIDDAHGTGVLGSHGRGLPEAQHLPEGQIGLTVGTLSKAIGSIGGFVIAPKPAVEMFINAGRSFIYTTALPPACSAASLAALRIIQSEEGRQRRHRVQFLAALVRRELSALGFDLALESPHPILEMQTPIIPVLMGESSRALAAAQRLREKGIWIPAIRPPTVPPNAARLRISVSADHTEEDIARLLEAMKFEI